MSPPKDLPSTHLPELPHGYEKVVLQDGSEVIIPQHLLPDLSSAFAAYRSMKVIGVEQAQHRFFQTEDHLSESISHGLISFPPNPLLSEQERLAAHAEVVSLMDLLGISYKDASHRLYMAELAKLKIADKTAKSMSNLAASIKDSLLSFQSGDQEDSTQTVYEPERLNPGGKGIPERDENSSAMDLRED